MSCVLLVTVGLVVGFMTGAAFVCWLQVMAD